jgi:hypothetical protein
LAQQGVMHARNGIQANKNIKKAVVKAEKVYGKLQHSQKPITVKLPKKLNNMLLTVKMVRIQ